MTPKTRLLLTFAAGLALGLTAGATCDRPANSGPPPLIANLRGHVAGNGLKDLKPIGLRVGDGTTFLNPRAEPRPGADPAIVTIYFELSGVPTSAWFEVAD